MCVINEGGRDKKKGEEMIFDIVCLAMPIFFKESTEAKKLTKLNNLTPHSISMMNFLLNLMFRHNKHYTC